MQVHGDPTSSSASWSMSWLIVLVSIINCSQAPSSAQKPEPASCKPPFDVAGLLNLLVQVRQGFFDGDFLRVHCRPLFIQPWRSPSISFRSKYFTDCLLLSVLRFLVWS